MAPAAAALRQALQDEVLLHDADDVQRLVEREQRRLTMTQGDAQGDRARLARRQLPTRAAWRSARALRSSSTLSAERSSPRARSASATRP